MIPEINDDPSVIESIFLQLKQNLKLRETHDIRFRKRALETLVRGYESMKEQISAAIKQDLGHNEFMAEMGSHSLTLTQIRHLISGLEGWAKPKSVPTPVGMGMASCQIKPEPLGIVLVISAWNYPIITAIPQVATAIAAGNAVILKPSENAPYTSNVLSKLFEKHLDQRFFRVIEGKVEIAKAITKLPFDFICFTGSTQTGRSVAIEAAKNLTPCLLQLGGKCPVIVDQTAKLESAAMRILFGRFLNCGQTCVGVDHVYIHQSLREKFKAILLEKAEEFYGGGQNLEDEGNYGKIINSFHTKRLQNLLKQDHGGTIIYGGQINHEKRYISPTIIQQPRKDSQLMKEEIFGPILPLFYYTDLRQTVADIVERPKPLVVYMFSQNSNNIQYVNQRTSSGTFVHNDAIIQMTNPDLPFGGVGQSGYGRSHGESGFLAFSNSKSVVKTTALNNFPLSERFPPYSASRKAVVLKLLKFGNITYGQLARGFLLITLLALIVTLGVVLIPRIG